MVDRVIHQAAECIDIAFDHFFLVINRTKTVGFKFADDLFDSLGGGFHLKQRLHRVKPGG